MGLEQLEQAKPAKLSVQAAADIMGVTRLFIQYGLQQGKFPFGVAVKFEKRWAYYINTKRFIKYMKSERSV